MNTHWIKFVFNPSLLISILTIPAVFFTAHIYGGAYAIIAVLAALIFYILFSWYSSNKPVNYNTPQMCMWDVASDIFAYTVNVTFCICWIFLAKSFLPADQHINLYYYTVMGFLILMNIATLIEMLFTIFNSLRAMYLVNPVHISQK